MNCTETTGPPSSEPFGNTPRHEKPKRNWRAFWRRFTIISALLLTLFVIAAWFMGGSLIAPVHRELGVPPADLPIIATTIDSESGSKLAAWHIPRPDSKATILLFHGIRGNRRTMLGRAKLFHNAGHTVIMIDFQAHGESPGDHITAGFLERHDVLATVVFARRAYPDHKIGVVGWSLGGASALLASPLHVDALVLESVYPTLAEAVHNRISMRLGPASSLLTPALLCQLKPRLGITPSDLRPIDHLAKVDCPILIAGGDLDEHTTLEETQRIFESAKESKKLVIFQGARHEDLLVYDQALYQKEIVSFLNVHCPSH